MTLFLFPFFCYELSWFNSVYWMKRVVLMLLLLWFVRRNVLTLLFSFRQFHWIQVSLFFCSFASFGEGLAIASTVTFTYLSNSSPLILSSLLHSKSTINWECSVSIHRWRLWIRKIMLLPHQVHLKSVTWWWWYNSVPVSDAGPSVNISCSSSGPTVYLQTTIRWLPMMICAHHMILFLLSLIHLAQRCVLLFGINFNNSRLMIMSVTWWWWFVLPFQLLHLSNMFLTVLFKLTWRWFEFIQWICFYLIWLLLILISTTTVANAANGPTTTPVVRSTVYVHLPSSTPMLILLLFLLRQVHFHL